MEDRVTKDRPGLSGVEGLKISRKKLVVKLAYAGESISDKIIDVKLDGSWLSVNEADLEPSAELGARPSSGSRRE